MTIDPMAPASVRAFKDEIEAIARAGDIHLALHLDFLSAWSLLATLQLACRHPAFGGATREVAERVARQVQEAIAPPGSMRGMVAEMGWDARYDVEREPR